MNRTLISNILFWTSFSQKKYKKNTKNCPIIANILEICKKLIKKLKKKIIEYIWEV